MKTRRNWLVAMALTVLLASLTAPLMALPTSASEQESDNTIKVLPESENWLKLESPIITVLLPRGGEKPMFIWWYTNAPDKIYVVKYQGLIEYFTFANPLLGAMNTADYYSHLREASIDKFSKIMEPMIIERLMELMSLINTNWHNPTLNFEAAKWSLSDIANITANGKNIGLTFAFTLIETPQRGFEFAENNIMIRVRMYNQTVQEEDQTGATYTVYPGEMKMDLVINKWVWNLDSITQLMAQLRKDGYKVPILGGKSGLALWVNLASINITRLTMAQSQPDTIEGQSTETNAKVDNTNVDVEKNQTATGIESPIEHPKPIVKINFANETTTLAGFFRFVSSATVDYHNGTAPVTVPVKASYVAAGNHMRLFIGYPYFDNGTLTHDPSIGVDTPNIDTTPKYSVQTPTGMNTTPVVIGGYIIPLFTPELMVALVAVVSATAIIIYAAKWKRKTPVNMVGPSTARASS